MLSRSRQASLKEILSFCRRNGDDFDHRAGYSCRIDLTLRNVMSFRVGQRPMVMTDCTLVRKGKLCLQGQNVSISAEM
jgi:hypothetical protein